MFKSFSVRVRFVSVFIALFAFIIAVFPLNVHADDYDDYLPNCIYWYQHLDSLLLNAESQLLGFSVYDSSSAFWRLNYRDDSTESVSFGQSHYFNADSSEDPVYIETFSLSPFGNNFIDLSSLSNIQNFNVGLDFYAPFAMNLSYHVEVNYFDNNLQLQRHDYFDGETVSLFFDSEHTSRSLNFSFDLSYNFAEAIIVFDSNNDAPFSVHVSNVYSSVYLDDSVRSSIYGTKFYDDLHDIAQSVFDKQVSTGELSGDTKIIVSMALEYFFRVEPEPPAPPSLDDYDQSISITYDPEDLSSFISQMESLIQQHASSFAAIALVFTLFMELPILAPLLYISLAFGICMCVLGIIPNITGHERRKVQAKRREEFRSSFKAKSGSNSK